MQVQKVALLVSGQAAGDPELKTSASYLVAAAAAAAAVLSGCLQLASRKAMRVASQQLRTQEA